jgi:DNA transposition AAA+ family ATPase
METTLKNQIVAALEAYLNEHKMSANTFATKSGVNASIISNLRSGKTTVSAGGGKEVEIADKYYAQIASAINFKLTKEYWKVIETRQTLLALSTLQDAKENGYTNVIIGETGSGKTFTADLFARQHPHDVFSLKIAQTDTITDVIDKIMDAAKINSSAKGKTRKINEIVKHMRKLKLEGHKPMIIFDEAEYMKQPCMCAIKALFDDINGECGIIIIGTPQLLRNLDRLRKKDKDGIPQFYRRIKFGIRHLDSVDRSFKQFFNELSITDKEVIRFISRECENYGELHDVLVPVLRELDRTGEDLSVANICKILNYRG